MAMPEEVDYVSGKTRLFGIVGHPIEQVRSPEMFTAEFRRRGRDAVLVPLHVLPDEFDAVLPQLLRLQNLDGLVFTIPFKVRACGFADQLGGQARVVGAINALARSADGRWRGDIFDGLGCVEAFRRREIGFAGKHVMLLGAGGAGSAIAVAVGFEQPVSLRIYDVDAQRARALAARVAQANPDVRVESGSPTTEGIDVLLNASPVGMLGDARLPFDIDRLPPSVVVFDAIVKPERTPLLTLAEERGCVVVYGREMMRGQMSRMIDFFLLAG
ncbi:MAG TPA: shikimate dehydrogenase [Casimicrobiaceae bacterium]|nr:shikimate dehydrogenase [Casimicrobiaceae bacterium]